jgi:hypothetical protein
MKRASVPKSQEQDERVKKAKLAVQARQVDSLGSRGVGMQVATAGRAFDSAVAPVVTGECAIFNMSDRMARALEAREASSE